MKKNIIIVIKNVIKMVYIKIKITHIQLKNKNKNIKNDSFFHNDYNLKFYTQFKSNKYLIYSNGLTKIILLPP